MLCSTSIGMGSTGIVEHPPHFFPYDAPRRLGQRSQQLAGGSTAALKGAIPGVEGRQHKRVLLGSRREVDEASRSEQRLQQSLIAEREKASDGICQAWLMAR
jgi:hypothetical protein